MNTTVSVAAQADLWSAAGQAAFSVVFILSTLGFAFWMWRFIAGWHGESVDAAENSRRRGEDARLERWGSLEAGDIAAARRVMESTRVRVPEADRPEDTY